MKKLLLFLIVIVLVVATASILLFVDKGEGIPAEDVLPSGALAYFNVKDLETKWNNVTETKFFSEVSQIDIISVMKKNGASAEEVARAEEMIDQLSDPEVHGFIKRFFGQEFAVAIYPTKFKDISLNSLYNIAANVIFVTRLDPQAEFMTFFADALGRFSKDFNSEVIEYRGEDIHMISTKDKLVKLGYVRIKDLFVFGFGDKPARRGVDTFRELVPALSTDKRFEKAIALQLPEADGVQYVDLETVVSDMKKQILGLATQKLKSKEEITLVEKKVEEGLRDVRGLGSVAVSTIFADPSRLKCDIMFDRSKMGADIAKLYACPAQDNRSLSFIPGDVLTYQWSSCFDLDYYWKQSKKEMQRAKEMNPEGNDPQAMIAGFEEKLGIGIERDLLPTIGDEMGGYLKDVNLNGMFPVPQLVLFLEVKDEAKAQGIIKSLIEKQPIFRPESDEHAGVGIQFFTVPLMADVQPAYAFVDGFLMVTTGKPMIKEAIDVRQGAVPGLKDRAGVQDAEINMGQNVNSVVYVKFDQLMGKARQLVAWADKWAQVQVSKQDAFIKGSELRLGDVRKNIEQWYQEIAAMEEEIVSLQGEEEAEEMTPFERLQLSVERKEKFIAKMQEGIDELEKEQKKLEAIEASEEQDLTPTGIARLKAVKEEVDKKNTKITGLKAELEAVKEERDVYAGAGERIDELKKMVETRKKDVRSARESEKELADIIAEYEARRIDPEKRKTMLNDLAKPLINALEAVDYLVSTARFGDGVLEWFVHYLVH